MKEIKVGAIIKGKGTQGTRKGVVTRFDSLNGYCNVLWEDGYTSLMNAEGIINMLVADETYDIENTLNAIKEEHKDTKPEIEIGAIVRGDFCNGVITKIDNAYDEVCVLWHDGEVSTETFGWTKKYLTGKKIKGLNGVLDEINEVNED